MDASNLLLELCYLQYEWSRVSGSEKCLWKFMNTFIIGLIYACTVSHDAFPIVKVNYLCLDNNILNNRFFQEGNSNSFLRFQNISYNFLLFIIKIGFERFKIKYKKDKTIYYILYTVRYIKQTICKNRKGYHLYCTY